MKPICPRPIFTLSFFAASNQKTINNSHFLAFSTQTHQNSYHPRRHEEESRAVRVSVWWDFENCNIPVNTNAYRVAQSITNAVRANGIKGPIQITAFGDVMQISRTNQEALSSTGISLTHVPSGGKNSADRSLLVDLMYWVSQNPPPAHLLLISGDRDFAGILHRLRMNNYNILLASPDSAPSVLCSAATLMWQWSSLLKGENLTGKLFNQPPDGPYHSWYGHYKTPLEDPFAIMGQSSYLIADKSYDVAPDSKLQPIQKAVMEQSSYSGADDGVAPNSESRPIPGAVMKYICRVLGLYPKGIAISQLRAELSKGNLAIDKDLYGFKKFSRFLSAMPHILQLQYAKDGQILVRRVKTKSLDESVPAENVELGTNNGEPEAGSVPKTCEEISYSEDVTEKSTVHPTLDPKVKAESTSLQDARKEEKQNESSLSLDMQGKRTDSHAADLQNLKTEEKQKAPLQKRNTQETHRQDRNVKLQKQPQKDKTASPVVEMKISSEKNEKQMLVPNGRSSAFGFGIFRKIWMSWFRSRDTKFDKACSGKDIVAKETRTPHQSCESIGPALFSPSSHEALIDRKIAWSGDVMSDISSQDSSYSNQTMSWFKFWSSPEFDDKVEKFGETADHFEVNPKKLDCDKVEKNSEAANCSEVNSKRLEIFAEESFWKEMELFLDSSQGSASISKSSTREHLAQNLQKQGPPFLRSLCESNLLQLVDLLISDKKWVEECNTRIFPFRLTRGGKDLNNNRPSSPNGLSHIFSGRQPNQGLGERKHQNPPHAGVPHPIVHRGSSGKPRSELMTDCQELVDQIVKEHPEGFNIGGFRKLFQEKHGYALDVQKLGYDKLVNLLQIMPGVRTESNLILPAGALKKNLDLQNMNPMAASQNDSSTKGDDSDSSWDELGPVDNSGSEKEEKDTRWLAGNTRKGRTEQRLPDYELLKEDDFSDSEEEPSSPISSENESKSKLVEEESSLLQILDSWYTDKEGDSKKDESMSTSNVIDVQEIGSQPSSPTSSVTRNESAVVKPTRKVKSGKRYSFVTEQPADNKDKLVDGILGSLKKSDEKSSSSQILS